MKQRIIGRKSQTFPDVHEFGAPIATEAIGFSPLGLYLVPGN